MSYEKFSKTFREVGYHLNELQEQATSLAASNNALHKLNTELKVKVTRYELALEYIAQFGSSEGDTKINPPRFQVARDALREK